MQRAVKGKEQVTFVRAAEEFAAQPGNSQSITDMMRLACEGESPSIRDRASDWLLRWCGVKVIQPTAAVLAFVAVLPSVTGS